MSKLARREFLAAAAAAPAAFTQSSSDSISVGMIGVGNRGSYTMQGVIAQPNAKVTAVCDIKPDRLDKAATAAKAKTYSDYRKLLDDKGIDAVYISTPCDLHVEMAIAALKAGKHVYCEKPLGITSDSIKQLLQVAKSSNKVFQVGQQMRSMKRIQNTVAKIHEGVIGKVMMVKAQRHIAEDLPHDGPSADWFFDLKRSGGYLVEMSVHNLDLCNWIINARPDRAAGFGGTTRYINDPPGRTIYDGYGLMYEYPNDVRLSYTQLVYHARGLPHGGSYTLVYGDKGSVDIDNSTMYPLEAKGAQPVELAPKVEEDRHAHTVAFLEAIRTGKKPNVDIEIGARAALTAILGNEAMYKKKVANWSEFGINL
jgi:myo-inositol 2-dehydrogenase / D-chiro-inositol 1-dehydrogenase